ncbi:MAG: FAD-dependent oxidoreductase [Desulfovibrio sp.]|jgi:all-trans-retinol 13,14-reductase|nr:FAD-dependent oxidoreductase [Desulfovibrio sp.]
MSARGDKTCIVVGAGLSGMTAALLLARRGRAVTLVEKKAAVGPTLRGFSRKGVHFDTGLHYAGGLSPGGPLLRYFSLLGLNDLPLAEFNPQGFDRIRFPDAGREITLPVGCDALTDALCSEFPADVAFIRRYLRELKNAFYASPLLRSDENRPFRTDAGLQDVFFPASTDKARADRGFHAGFRNESLDTVLRKGTGNDLLRAVLSIHSLLYGVSPEEIPFLQHARVAGSYLEGVKTVRGGGKRLVETLEKRLTEAGVDILRGTAAKGFHLSPDNRINGLELEDGRLLPADDAIFTAHPALLPALLPPGAVKPAFVRRLLSLEDTVSSFTLFCASEVPVPALAGNNLFICFREGPAPGFRPTGAAAAGPFYISGLPLGTRDVVPGLPPDACGSVIPPGTGRTAYDVPSDAGRTVSVLPPDADRTASDVPFGAGDPVYGLPADCGGAVPKHGHMVFAPGHADSCKAWARSKSGNRPAAYGHFKAETLDSVRSAVLRHCPELASLNAMDGATPLTYRDFLESPGCGMYGTKHSLHQFSPLPATRIPNLWTAGQSVIAPGILGAIISGVTACAFVLGPEAIHEELAACRCFKP